MGSSPAGIIMIRHEGFRKIDPQKCIDALPESWQKLSSIPIVVSYSESISLAEAHEADFSQFALEHKRKYVQDVLPIIEEHRNYQIVYFGLVPIPLGIDFGHIVGNDRKVEIYQFHNEKKKWYQSLECQNCSKEQKFTKDLTLITSTLPSVDQKGIIDALVRINISHRVNSEETSNVLPNAAEIDYGFKKPKEAIIDSKEKLLEIGEGVKEIFDNLSSNKSELKVIHLFAAIPCGVAFLIGTKISATIHPYIQTYQYKKTESPKYSKALLVKKKNQFTKKLSETDRKGAEELRRIADKELRSEIQSFCIVNRDFLGGRKYDWPLDLISIGNGIMNEAFWSELPPISLTGIENDECSKTPDTVENGYVRKGNKWHIDDYFFAALSRNKKIDTNDKLRKALRLFFFHEILHAKKHDMQDGKHENIGGFPKVLETADYQADVYAILNECGFQARETRKVKDPKEFFKKTIEVAIETMWCFDYQSNDLTQIQIRRFNRYLIWYWQLIRIEKTDGTLNIIVKILEEKPTIELSGLKFKIENGRHYFDLERRQGKYLEMAVFHNNRVIRNGSASNFQIEHLLDGFKKMDSKIILDELRKFYSTPN